MAQTASNSGKRNLTGWMLFLATLLLLSFAAQPGHEEFSVVADRSLVAVRLSLVLALSVLVVRERFSGGRQHSGDLLQRCRRWFYDE